MYVHVQCIVSRVCPSDPSVDYTNVCLYVHIPVYMYMYVQVHALYVVNVCVSRSNHQLEGYTMQFRVQYECMCRYIEPTSIDVLTSTLIDDLIKNSIKNSGYSIGYCRYREVP